MRRKNPFAIMPGTAFIRKIWNVVASGGTVITTIILAASMVPPQAAAQVETVDQIRYPELPSAEIPKPDRHVLDNGMVVMLLEDDELPLINARMLIRTGARWEPADKVGLAGLTGQVMRSGGTQNRPSDELDDYLEDMAASIETSISTRTGSASLDCLKDDFSELLQVFAEVLRQPAFEESKLAVAKNQTNAGIARQNDDAGSIASREYAELIYGSDSPYTRQATYGTIAAIERQDLIDWHAKYYHPDRMILGLTGDFDKAKALALVKKVFGAWPRGSQFEEPEIQVDDKPRPGVFFVEKSDVNQSSIRIGHLGIQRDNPDYYKVELMNQVFGGSFASRMFNNIRSKKGLAYDPYGGVSARWDYPGMFTMSMSTKTETTGVGVEALQEEARLLTAQPPTEAEIEKARSGILNSFVFNSDSKSKILSQQLSFEYYGYPLDWLERYRKGIESTTKQDVLAVAEKYIRPADFTILVVGAPAAREQLSAFGEVQDIDITIPEPAAPEVEMTAESQEEARVLLAKAVEAVGGAEKLATIRQIETTSSLTMATPQGEMGASSTTLIVLPDRVRQELALPFGTMTQVVDRDSGFMITPQGTVPMPADRLADQKREARRNLVLLLRQHAESALVASASGSGEVAGTQVETVYIEQDGEGMTLGIDPRSGQVLSLEYRGTGMTGAPGQIRQIYSDYREQDGFQLPFAIEISFEGEKMLSATVENMVINGEEDPEAFVQP